MFVKFVYYSVSVSIILDIVINNEKITRVDQCKYLGVHFEYIVRWNKHIENLINKTKYLVFLFYRLREIMSCEVLKMIYYACFHSGVNYGIIAWGGLYKTESTMLQNIQNRLLKLMRNDTLPNEIPLSIKQSFHYDTLVYITIHLKDYSIIQVVIQEMS